MALPITRNTTYTAATPPRSADLNAIQDAIVGGKHGQILQLIPPSAVQSQAATIGYNFIGDYAEYTGGGSAVAGFPIFAFAGDRIINAQVDLYGASVHQIALIVRPALGGVITVVATSSPTTTAAWSSYTIGAAGAGYTLLSTDSIYFKWQPSAAGARIGTIRVLSDHP